MNLREKERKERSEEEKKEDRSMEKEKEREEKKMKEKYVECLVYVGPILYLVYIIYLSNYETLPNPCYYL